ncbi:LysR family transcriptional regulator [Paraburkholderia rhizosphaerae]|uniref:LysR family transcriptional regulator n=1 Tax=Paraburkholderia rhizosphaerae TaxID=480658 RepID=A0A4R8LSY0_9BURK|nr:LysR substrate-binding domain-containing protein [Paraburkholderia rhizosphaerae]TDY50789.1 LysR family transcriptional regulator [Paraburkholderia rhizosphaerae]
MTKNLEIGLLRAFVTIADHGSMTAAGNALHLTQGAISQRIARLEALSGQLFFRDHRDVRLTPVGERLLGHARRLLDLHDGLVAEIAEDALAGKIRLGAPQDLVSTHLGSILKAFAQSYPQVEVSLVCDASPELLRVLKQGKIDIALVEELPGSSRGECLVVDRLVWVGARGGTAHKKSPLPISMVAETCAFRRPVLDALRKQDRSWRTMFENGSHDATVATVRSDLAITAFLASTVPPGLDILVPQSGLPVLPCFEINLYLSARRSPPAVVELARHLRDGMMRCR